MITYQLFLIFAISLLAPHLNEQRAVKMSRYCLGFAVFFWLINLFI